MYERAVFFTGILIIIIIIIIIIEQEYNQIIKFSIGILLFLLILQLSQHLTLANIIRLSLSSYNQLIFSFSIKYYVLVQYFVTKISFIT